MSIDLVNLSHKQKNLSSSEHSILNVMAFRANDSAECWPSIKSLCESTSLNEKTAQSAILSLLSKGILIRSGEMKGKTKRTPVYKVNLNTPKKGCVQNLNTPNISKNTPKNGAIKYPLNRDMERSDLKSQRKGDFSNSKGPQAFKEIYKTLLSNQIIKDDK